MKKLLLFILSFCFVNVSFCQSSGTDNYWQQQVNYTIDVTLNDKENTLDGNLKMEYINNSPDTLHFIWIHLWQNAYKNDKSAFSDQLLENGRTDFYFSKTDQSGYINRLDFRVDGIRAEKQDHPQHQDIIKIILPKPLAPYSTCKIETPFHEKIPFNFSRGGHVGQSYQLTQWYPKPAVYDRKGWHPMPYLDQGEFYSEFGNYKVSITLPKKYLVAATGKLTDTSSSSSLQTLSFEQTNVHDFALFADKRFIKQHDTLLLPSGRIIDVYAYSLPIKPNRWYSSAIKYIKNAVLTRSKWLGEYPYNIVTAIEAEMGFEGGMEYPCITSISPEDDDPEGTIEHEVGHNWNYGILATNERDHPWMDEGINSFFDDRYSTTETISKPVATKATFMSKRMPKDKRIFQLQNAIATKTDQPIETVSEKFTERNYYRIPYDKTALWLKYVEASLGHPLFDSCMHEYYNRWKFKHPYPEDFKKVFEDVSRKNLDQQFALLNVKGSIPAKPVKKDIKIASFFSFKDTDKHHYIFVAPAIGYNLYDKFMIGAVIHNYTLPAEKFQFMLAPLYGTDSKKWNGIGTLNYHWYPDKYLQKIEIGVNGSHFSSNHSLDTAGNTIVESFSKIVPYLRLNFKHSPRSNKISYIDLRSYIINEKQFDNYDYKAGSDSINLYPKSFSKNTRYINQLSFGFENTRALYPYNYQLQLQQGDGFYRINATGNYFFNYSKGGGIEVRLFAAKFGYLGAKDYSTYLYQPKLLAGNGDDDYTNSNYFIGRTASSSLSNPLLKNGGLAAQQIMINNTGGLKMRLDPYTSVQGYSENWIAAANLSTTLPKELMPEKIPIKAFLDIGTYAEAWGKNPPTNRFLYTAGLQLSLFKNILNIYAPILYSKAFKDQLKTDPEANKFLRKITFSINIQNLNAKKLFPQLPL